MTSPQSRRDVLKGTAALAAAVAVGSRHSHPPGSRPGRPGRPHRRRPEAGGRRQGRARRRGDGRDRQGRAVRGRVRRPRARPAGGDDPRHRLPHRLDDQGDRHRRGHAARRAGQAHARGTGAQHRPDAGLAHGPRRLRRRRRAEGPSRQGTDHAAPAADAHRRVQLRHLGPGHRALHQGHGDAEPGHRQGGVPPPAAGVRPGRPVAVRHQHRVDGPAHRDGQRRGARGLSSASGSSARSA